jgi:hypothetical protein
MFCIHAGGYCRKIKSLSHLFYLAKDDEEANDFQLLCTSMRRINTNNQQKNGQLYQGNTYTIHNFKRRPILYDRKSVDEYICDKNIFQKTNNTSHQCDSSFL